MNWQEEARRIAGGVRFLNSDVVITPGDRRRGHSTWGFTLPNRRAEEAIRLYAAGNGYPLRVQVDDDTLTCDVYNVSEAVVVISKHLEHFRGNG